MSRATSASHTSELSNRTVSVMARMPSARLNNHGSMQGKQCKDMITPSMQSQFQMQRYPENSTAVCRLNYCDCSKGGCRPPEQVPQEPPSNRTSIMSPVTSQYPTTVSLNQLTAGGRTASVRIQSSILQPSSGQMPTVSASRQSRLNQLSGKAVADCMANGNLICPANQPSTMRQYSQRQQVGPTESTSQTLSDLVTFVPSQTAPVGPQTPNVTTMCSLPPYSPCLVQYCDLCGQYHAYRAEIPCLQANAMLQRVPSATMSARFTRNGNGSGCNCCRATCGGMDSGAAKEQLSNIREQPTRDNDAACTCKSYKDPSTFKVWPGGFNEDKFVPPGMEEAPPAEAICLPCGHTFPEGPKDTTWRVKIMKDCGCQSLAVDNGIQTQTSETRIVNADKLETLLPESSRFQDGADYACLPCKFEGERANNPHISCQIAKLNDDGDEVYPEYPVRRDSSRKSANCFHPHSNSETNLEKKTTDSGTATQYPEKKKKKNFCVIM